MLLNETDRLNEDDCRDLDTSAILPGSSVLVLAPLAFALDIAISTNEQLVPSLPITRHAAVPLLLADRSSGLLATLDRFGQPALPGRRLRGPCWSKRSARFERNETTGTELCTPWHCHAPHLLPCDSAFLPAGGLRPFSSNEIRLWRCDGFCLGPMVSCHHSNRGTGTRAVRLGCCLSCVVPFLARGMDVLYRWLCRRCVVTSLARTRG